MTLRLALAALALLAAGCVDGATPAADVAGASLEPDAAAALPQDVMLQHGCQSFYSGHRVDVAYAEARLPDGLEPYAYRDLGGALLTLKSWTCLASSVDGVAIPSGNALVYYIAVVPDERYDAEHVGFSWYPLEIVTATPELADAFRAWGFTVADAGDVAIEWNEGTDPWVVRVQAEGASRIDATVTIPSYADGTGEFTVRYFAAEDGRVTGAVDIVVHAGARGGMGPTAWRLEGAHAPSPLPLVGTSSYQGWNEGELSYTWTPVAFDS